MKENKYDDNIFFQKYSQMSRSQQGLAGAGEWETLRKLLPSLPSSACPPCSGYCFEREGIYNV